MICHIPANASGITLIKGMTVIEDRIEMISDTVKHFLEIPCGALMGANIANDIAKNQFCESTIAFDDESLAEQWSKIFNQPNLRIKTIRDVVLQQLCGTIKNIVATCAGFVDGLGYGESRKAAIIRIGMEETFKFAQCYFSDRNCTMATLLESCGVADFIATSYGGRNHKCAVEFVKTKKDIHQIEEEILNGQKLQGVVAADEIFKLLKIRNEFKRFPLLVTVHLIATRQVPPETIIDYDGNHLNDLQ
jgi:glycerol-3-phosphate dehydrogenase (NAD+)